MNQRPPMGLAELRRTLKLPQREIARRLGKGQEEVSRIENRADLRLSTLQSYVGSLGGTLELLCRFGDRSPVRLRTSGSATAPTQSAGRRLPRLPRSITRHAAGIVRLCQQHTVRQLAVFGSALRADFDPAASRIDFVAEFAPDAERSLEHRYGDFKVQLEALLGCSVHLVEPRALLALPHEARQRTIEESPISLYAEAG